MKKHLLCGLLLIPLAFTAKGINVNRVYVDSAYSATSVNVAVFRNSSIVTRDSLQYVSYYDPEGYVTIARRSLDSKDWEIERSPYRGKVTDGHNVISMIVDDNNIIHISFDHHGNKLKYCRSVEPGSLTLGPLQPMTSSLEDDVTYPEFYRLANGNILFAYRSGASGRGNLVLNVYNITTGEWKRVHDVLIDGENQRNAYWQLYVDPEGTIHLSWVWRETWLVETNHDMCYAKSTDNGLTWQRSDGTPYSLPITMASAEVACAIPQKSELINQTSMITDADGNPYIATYWRDSNDSIPQYRLIWNNNGKWHNRKVNRRTTPFSLAGGGTKMIPVSRPRVVIDNNYVMYVTRDVERGGKVTLYVGNINDESLTPVDITDFNVGAWEPSVDSQLWMSRHKLHLYVQRADQGDGERVTNMPPQPVYIYEISR